MTAGGEGPEIIECEIRLHSSRPAGAAGDEASWSEWSQTAASDPVTFQARAMTGQGVWGGPLPPGVEVAAPVPLEDPSWTVFLPRGTGRPIVTGEVGRPLAIGETFKLAAAEPGAWTEGVVFEGAIVAD